MRAGRIKAYGDVDVLNIEEIDLPAPEAGQAQIKIEAAGVNFIDIYFRKGQYPAALPSTLGMEAAGVVEAVGPDATEVRVGDRVVYAMEQGSYAEWANVEAWKLTPIPDGVSSNVAAAAFLQGLTAQYLSRSTWPLKSGEYALVHAAAGGVGQLLVQMAVARGAQVIATVSTEEKAQLAREAGAQHVVRYTEQDFAEEAKRITDGRGVDVVYDSVGESTFWKSLDSLRPRGLLALYGQASGPVPPIDLQILNLKGSLYVTRPSLASYASTRKELLGRAGDLFTGIESGALKVRIDKEYSLDDVREAHKYMEGRQTKGKVLLIP